jgi:hypothetical protein
MIRIKVRIRVRLKGSDQRPRTSSLPHALPHCNNRKLVLYACRLFLVVQNLKLSRTK